MLNRLLAIIYILMNRGTVTAAELAERFEVSARTIYRDVEALSMAGIPVYTTKGKNGGISLTQQFVLNKMLVSREEQVQILAGLASLTEVGVMDEAQTLQKLGEFFQVNPQNWVSIDFSDWSGRRRELFGQLRQAVLNHQVMEFDYYGQYGAMSRRQVEPVQLVFREYTWYLRAWCRGRKAMRLFKVLRMKRVEVLEEHFLPDGSKHREQESCEGNGQEIQQVGCEGNGQEIQHAKCEGNGQEIQHADCQENYVESPQNRERRQWERPVRTITMRVEASEAYRIYDRFEEEEITVQEDGSFLVTMECLVDDWVYGLILSFGPSARVLEPPEVAAELKSRLEKMCASYGSVLLAENEQ